MESTNPETTRKFNEKTGTKIIIIALMCLLLLIPWLLIRSTISERDDTQSDAEKEVFEKWGESQTIKGPAIRVHSKTKTIDKDKENKDEEYFLVLPETLNINTNAEVRTLNRGIYDFTVYDAEIIMTGDFSMPKDLEGLKLDGFKLNCWKMEVSLSSLKGLTDNPAVSINGKEISPQDISFEGTRVFWPLDISPLLEGEKVHYEIKLPLRGSKALEYIPIGNTTTVNMHSNCPTPSFCGNFLPIERTVTKDGFDAEWKVLAINRSFSQIVGIEKWIGMDKEYYYGLDDEDEGRDNFGVELRKPVEQYQQNERAVKYAYLIVLITFAIIFFIELRREHPIHPIQYLLIGIAIMIFYILLLSFSEHISFSLAYLIASIMTVVLLGCYLGAIMKDKKVGIIISSVLAVFYAFIYILLQIENYALLFGSIGLFIVVAICMVASQRIDWYKKQ